MLKIYQHTIFEESIAPAYILFLTPVGRPLAYLFLAPNLAVRYGFIPINGSPIIPHAGLARRAGAPRCVHGLARMSSQKSNRRLPAHPDDTDIPIYSPAPQLADYNKLYSLPGQMPSVIAC
jgi:hypothetical protein